MSDSPPAAFSPTTVALHPRKIIHFDADCFYAAVEMRDNPALRGIPLAVGGPADRRGVVATCNYEARAFGVRSAMPTRHALKLCPQLQVVMPDFARYKVASQAIFSIYREYSELIEPLSLDEAYVDVSACSVHSGSATRIAQEIRARVKAETGLVVSAGAAPNKFLAKIASDWHKPDGLFVIRPQDVDAFVAQLPVEKLFGVGPRTAEKLHRLKLFTCADIRTRDLPFLRAQFGKLGTALYQSARGIDTRMVRNNHVRKSISVETTFAHDLFGFEDCVRQLPELHADLIGRIERNHAQALIQKTFVKLRMDDFKVRTLEVNERDTSMRQFEQLLRSACQRNMGGVRLIGLGVRLRAPEDVGQLDLL